MLYSILCSGHGKQKNGQTLHKNRGKYQTIQNTQHEENTSPSVPLDSLDGSRIINLKELASFITDMSSHSQSCKTGTVYLVSETYKNGMASVLCAKCNSCYQEIRFTTCLKLGGVGTRHRWETNVAGVWGQMATGGGHARLEEVMAVFGVPVMTKRALCQLSLHLTRSGGVHLMNQ